MKQSAKTIYFILFFALFSALFGMTTLMTIASPKGEIIVANNSLTTNHTEGALGSFFTINGSGFSANTIISASTNDRAVGQVKVKGDGTITFVLATNNADVGRYIITIPNVAGASTSFVLDDSAPIQPLSDTSAPLFSLPANIALPTFTATPSPTNTPTNTPTVTETPSPIPTATATHTPIPTSTPTVIHTPTSTPTQMATVTSTPITPTLTPVPGGDVYESDNICAQAREITLNGIVEAHTFHVAADEDWVKFEVTSGETYLVDIQVPVDSTADINLEAFDGCDHLPLPGIEPYRSYSSNARIRYEATEDGMLLIKLFNGNPSDASPRANYTISARILPSEPPPGTILIVGGRLKNSDPLQDNIDHVTDTAYEFFKDEGYDEVNEITYLATEQRTGVDGMPTKENIESTIRAAENIESNGTLTIYMMDHGEKNIFYLDKDIKIDPDILKIYLDNLQSQRPDLRVIIIIEACNSGSFMTGTQTLVNPAYRRLILTSTSDERLAYASDEGAVFSDQFLGALRSGATIHTAFQNAKEAVESIHEKQQQPWLDANGDGISNDIDLEIAAIFSYANTGGSPDKPAYDEVWPPYIANVIAPSSAISNEATIQADVRDDQDDIQRVWAVIEPPSYQPPTESNDGLIQLADKSHCPLKGERCRVDLTDVGDYYELTYQHFTESGTYRVQIHATDSQGVEARPVEVEIENHLLFLPSVLS